MASVAFASFDSPSVLRISAAPRRITNMARLSSRSSPLVITARPGRTIERRTRRRPRGSACPRRHRLEHGRARQRRRLDAIELGPSRQTPRRDVALVRLARFPLGREKRRAAFVLHLERREDRVRGFGFGSGRGGGVERVLAADAAESRAAVQRRGDAPSRRRAGPKRRHAAPTNDALAATVRVHASVRVPFDAARVSRAGRPIVALGELDVDAFEKIETVRERMRREHATRARTEPESAIERTPGLSPVVVRSCPIPGGPPLAPRQFVVLGVPRVLVIVEEKQASERVESPDGGWHGAESIPPEVDVDERVRERLGSTQRAADRLDAVPARLQRAKLRKRRHAVVRRAQRRQAVFVQIEHLERRAPGSEPGGAATRRFRAHESVSRRASREPSGTDPNRFPPTS